MRVTVFTPTYNRAYIIEKLYRSLQRQTFRDFEWVVIDDGSTDNTRELFECFITEKNDFPIRYEKVENGGKHRAINRGVALAQGDLFFIVDSDDYLTNYALERIDMIEKTIPMEQKHIFAGVSARKGYDMECPIGSTFEGEIKDITTLERVQNGITGDQAEVFYTTVMRQYPFPEFEGEKFMTECVVWDRMAYDGYKLRFFKDIVTVCNYLPDGLTTRIGELHMHNPRGYGLYLYQSIQFDKLSGMHKWNSLLNYYGSLRKCYRFDEIASFLHMNPIRLGLRLFGMRVFYYLYR